RPTFPATGASARSTVYGSKLTLSRSPWAACIPRSVSATTSSGALISFFIDCSLLVARGLKARAGIMEVSSAVCRVGGRLLPLPGTPPVGRPRGRPIAVGVEEALDALDQRGGVLLRGDRLAERNLDTVAAAQQPQRASKSLGPDLTGRH